jgi:hypothetical protein
MLPEDRRQLKTATPNCINETMTTHVVELDLSPNVFKSKPAPRYSRNRSLPKQQSTNATWHDSMLLTSPPRGA